jgi:RNA polymerase sigma-70 factor, ECF subfamily
MNTTSHSLLRRLQEKDADETSWQRLVALYKPLLLHWLRQSSTQTQDIDDLTQEILAVIVKEVATFQHPGHTGAFRAWLKAIAVNRIRTFSRTRKLGPAAPSTMDFVQLADQLDDPESQMSRVWDEEHDRHVLRGLLEIMEAEFEPKTLEAFRRVTLKDEPAKLVAADLGMTIGAVYVAKSAVLRRLREEAKGLID